MSDLVNQRLAPMDVSLCVLVGLFVQVVMYTNVFKRGVIFGPYVYSCTYYYFVYFINTCLFNTDNVLARVLGVRTRSIQSVYISGLVRVGVSGHVCLNMLAGASHVPQAADPVCPWPRPRPGLCRLPSGHDHAASVTLLVLPLLLHAADSGLGQPGEPRPCQWASHGVCDMFV